ncbi:MAG: 2-amino-4-hydroxy-6-hydroxymethyldihydropteridine diphosphokinase [Pirellulales bacterium]|nr:2-amino-4-hydroxy-6-hydroxymethyldihydropteridine diphosphokinase [Pirellulales bacterium]
MPVCLIGIGSNQAARRDNLESAAARLADHPRIELLARSAWLETVPIGGPSGQPRFLNGALKLETSLAPQELFELLQQIEIQLGRRREQRWGPRTIDLDLLLYGDLVMDAPSLTVPHPRMAWRRFVLEPAAEAAGEMVHPTIGWTVARLLRHLNASPPYIAVAGGIAAGKSRLAERLAADLDARLIEERPDWERLESFYSNPAANAWETELAFLDQRIELLGKDLPNCWAVSDFWFDQSAAFAGAWLPPSRIDEYMRRFEAARQGVAQPRLLVLLDAPAETLHDRVRERGRASERRLTVAHLDRIRRKVVERAARPGVGPVLRPQATDWEEIAAEALAAARATE